MNSWFLKGMIAAVIALPLVSSGTAWAGGSNDFGCSNATLKGLYAFGATVYPPGSGQQPSVVAGIKIFDGNGGLTQRDYIGGSTPAEFAKKGQETGTYLVDPDCTGSMVIYLNVGGMGIGHGVIKILFVISDGGRHIHEVVSEITPPGSTTPVANHTSADDWKVASEQDD
jgi:hypothetical protein